MAEQKILVPDIGDFTDVDIIEVHVKEGDDVEVEDAVITLETEKAAMDVPSTHKGKVISLSVHVGDKVSEGSPILTLETAGSGETSARAPEADIVPEQSEGGVAEPAAAESDIGDTAIKAAPRMREVVVPDIGEFTDVDVVEVFVAPGDRVAVDSPLLTLETEKATMDVPSPFAGTVTTMSVKQGDKVSQDDLILVLEADAETEAGAKPDEAPTIRQPGLTTPPAPEKPSPPRPAPAPASPARAAGQKLPPIDEKAFARAHASPAVRKFARELGVNLGQVKGTGTKSRIIKDDVKAFVKSILTGEAGAAAGLPRVPSVDFAKFGPVESRPLSRIKKIAGPRLQASWVNLPHVTQHDEADITELEAARQRLKVKASEQGIKLTPLAFVMKACVKALQEFPQFNSSLDEENQALVIKKYHHLGFAADTPNGLVVPVIRDADKKDVYELARELGELSAKAREGKLKAEEMQGGCFTVSSLGGIGGTAFTPIINAPEVAILGLSRSKMAPVYRDGEFVARLMLPLSLSYDHRVIDGAEAVRFTTYLGNALADVNSLLEAIP